MNIDKWLLDNTVYLTVHGSQCYGLANDLSDVDVKGVCLPPLYIRDNILQNFEQAENNPTIEAKFESKKNPKNPKFESVVYSLKKFLNLAANVNPNIIEILFTDNTDMLMVTSLGQRLLDNKHLFLSVKAKYTFSGYSVAQLHKIQRHKKWIDRGEIKKPTRSDFGLPERQSPQTDEIFGYIKSNVELWNLSKFNLDDIERDELKETIWELIYNLSDKRISWDNWPSAYEAATVNKLGDQLNLKDDVIDLIQRERLYNRELNTYNSWVNWKKNRNPERAKLELKCGYDSKHACHLIRLLKMAHEILIDGKVVVKRPDRDELLEIKNGHWTYERVIDYADLMQKKLDESTKFTKLPRNVDMEKINALYYELITT